MRTEVTAAGKTYGLSKILHYMTPTGLQDVNPFERKERLLTRNALKRASVFLCHMKKLLKASDADNSRTG